MIREKRGDGENIERDKRFGTGVFFLGKGVRYSNMYKKIYLFIYRVYLIL